MLRERSETQTQQGFGRGGVILMSYLCVKRGLPCCTEQRHASNQAQSCLEIRAVHSGKLTREDVLEFVFSVCETLLELKN